MASIQTRIGKIFEISMQGNPSTGFRWHPQFEPSFLNLEGRRFARDSSKTGGGGLEFFHFQALKAGNTEIVMRFQRGWQQEAVQEEIVIVSIIP